MFDALGDSEVQTRIRKEYPDARHCDLLMQSASACIGCPKNPYPKAGIAKTVQESAHLTRWAERLGKYAELGILPNITNLTAAEVLAADMSLHVRQHTRDRELASMIAMKVGEVISQMFGGKKNG